MLPPEFQKLLSEIKDYQEKNPTPRTFKERAKTLFFVSLFLFFVAVFIVGYYYQEIKPRIMWLFATA
jgi:cytochrome b561